MQWLEITITTTEDASDAICEMLAQIGADGIAVSDPWEIKRIIEDPDSLAYADDGYVDSLGTDVVIKSYFAEFDGNIRLGAKSEEYENPVGVGMIYGNFTDKLVSHEEALNIIKERVADIAQFLPIGEGFSGWKYVQDADWENEWKKDYKSFRISDRVIICPSWEDTKFDESDVVVKLDPGSAFGTGTHETTSMCSVILDKLMNDNTKVLDLGTGSGILAIIAKKLGAGEVEAIDIDKLAVDVAIDNCANNGCSEIICHAGELKDAYKKDYDIVVANIIADVIAMIAKDVPSVMAPNGKFVCSGIINTKKERVEEALKEAGFVIEESMTKNDWMAYICSLAG